MTCNGIRYSIAFYFIGSCGTEVCVDMKDIKSISGISPESSRDALLKQLPMIENPRPMTDEELNDYLARIEEEHE